MTFVARSTFGASRARISTSAGRHCSARTLRKGKQGRLWPKPYALEMTKLPETFDWAATVELTPLRQAVRTAGVSPLRVIGSGGSLTCAHALAGLHQRYTGRLAAVATPLEAVAEPLDANVSAWLLSAGGGNVDILNAARALIPARAAPDRRPLRSQRQPPDRA